MEGSTPLFGDGEQDKSAESRIFYGLLPAGEAQIVFDRLQEEVNWQRMYHQTGEVPRLVCCQGDVDERGNTPVYRHPSDRMLPTEPWNPTVKSVRDAAELAVGRSLNHVLIQLYRGRQDFISEHSDKTLDVLPNSFIVNVSFGAQRTMRLRTKRLASANGEPVTRKTYRVCMPHNSMLLMSLRTNAEYLHGICADKRPTCELTEDEKGFGEVRISLTFRSVGTFLSADSSKIWGQGALNKDERNAGAVINSNQDEGDRLLRAFAMENQASKIEWQAVYGDGFDVLHLR